MKCEVMNKNKTKVSLMFQLYKNMQQTEFAWRITHNENIFTFSITVFIFLVYFTTLLVSPTIVWNGRMTDKWWIGENLEGTSHGLSQVLSHYTSAGAVEVL